VDAIILTGGAAHSKKLTGMIKDYAGHLGEFVIMPGEKELEALAAGAYRIVTGKEAVNEYDPL
jgi:butyrate kinase